MKCPKCGAEKKDEFAVCKKCGTETPRQPIWMPDWKWHARTLAIIYVIVTIAYFAASSVLHRLKEPYNLRQISPEMTPWLKNKK